MYFSPGGRSGRGRSGFQGLCLGPGAVGKAVGEILSFVSPGALGLLRVSPNRGHLLPPVPTTTTVSGVFGTRLAYRLLVGSMANRLLVAERQRDSLVCQRDCLIERAIGLRIQGAVVLGWERGRAGAGLGWDWALGQSGDSLHSQGATGSGRAPRCERGSAAGAPYGQSSYGVGRSPGWGRGWGGRMRACPW